MSAPLKSVWKTMCRKKRFVSAEDEANQPPKCLNVVDVTCLGLATVLGTGAYILIPQAAYEFAGPSVVISLLIAAVTSCLGGLCYSEMATRFPRGGSAYVYAYATIGEMCAVLLGWMMVLEYSLGTALAAKSCVQYVDVTFNETLSVTLDRYIGKMNVPGLDQRFDVFSMVVVIVGGILLSIALKILCLINNAMVIMNLLVLSGIVLIAAFNMDAENWTAGQGFFPNGASGVISGASLCYFCFIGYDIMAISSAEANNRSRVLPTSMSFVFLVGLLTAFTLAVAITLFVPAVLLGSRGSLLEAFAARGVFGMQYFATAGATVGFLSATLASMFALTRLLESLARDGFIFSFLAGKSNHQASIITSCVITSMLAAVCDNKSLVHAIGIGSLSASTAVAVSVLCLRYGVLETLPLEAALLSHDSTISDLYLNRADAGTQTSVQHHCKDSISNLSRSLVSESNMVDYGSVQRRSLSVDYVNETFVTCFSDFSPHWGNLKSPNRKSSATVMGLVTATIIVMILMGIVILRVPKIAPTTNNTLWTEIIASVLFLAVLVLAAMICRQPKHKPKCPNRVPCIPLLPMCTIWMNVHLLVGLPFTAWLLFLVWDFIGSLLYLGYGVRHSTVKRCGDSPDVNLLSIRDDCEDNEEDQEVLADSF